MPQEMDINAITSWLAGAAITYGIKAILFLILLYITWKAAGWTKKAIITMTEKKNLDLALGKFFSSLGRYAVLTIGVITALGTVGIETATFAAVLAASGFAVGMALQGTLGHFASGVMLLIFRPFELGHVITVGGTTGKVAQIDLFSTALDTTDNRRIIIPNGAVYGQKIENTSHHSTRRVDIAVGTAYEADLDATRKILMDAATSIPEVLKDPETAVALTNLGASSVDWAIRAWVKTDDYWSTKDELTRRCKYALDEAKISIPYPQMDVNFSGAEGLPLSAQKETPKSTNPSMQ